MTISDIKMVSFSVNITKKPKTKNLKFKIIINQIIQKLKKNSCHNQNKFLLIYFFFQIKGQFLMGQFKRSLIKV